MATLQSLPDIELSIIQAPLAKAEFQGSSDFSPLWSGQERPADAGKFQPPT